MERLDYMVTIVDVDVALDYMNFFQKQGVQVVLKATGYGTAKDEVRRYLGLGEAEKRILFATMTRKKALHILDLFDGERQLNRPGAGIAFTVPISSVAGVQALELLTGNTISEGEMSMTKPRHDHEVLLVVAARGHIDTIMDSARKAGVTGGTVIHALGTTPEQDEREFYGISVGSEKELIIMLVKSEIKDGVMKQIADEAGMHTAAHALVFSLPVSAVAGLGEKM